jgi:hypothetical protein
MAVSILGWDTIQFGKCNVLEEPDISVFTVEVLRNTMSLHNCNLNCFTCISHLVECLQKYKLH